MLYFSGYKYIIRVNYKVLFVMNAGSSTTFKLFDFKRFNNKGIPIQYLVYTNTLAK